MPSHRRWGTRATSAIRPCVRPCGPQRGRSGRAGRYAGSFARDASYARLLRESGFAFIAYLADAAALRIHFRTVLEDLRADD
jgi:hypothetical protein